MLTLAVRLIHDGDTARDIVHDVFASLLAEQLETVTPAYLLRGVRYACLNYIRNRSVRDRLSRLYTLDTEEIEDNVWPDEEDIARLNSIVDSQLTEQCRRVVRIRFTAHLTYKEIAEELSISEVAVYKHLHHAMYIFPRLNFSWGAVRGLFMRFSGEISGYAPSLADLSSVTQQIDAYQARRGNPNLKAVTYYSSQFMTNWDFCRFMGIGSIAIYSYDHRPVMEQDIAKNSIIIRTMDNQRGFHRLNWHTWLFVKPLGNYITLRLTALYQRFISQGNNYVHTHSALGFYGELFASWRNWSFIFDFRTASNEFWGETLRKGERNHNFTLRYNCSKWSAAVCIYNPFEKTYRQTVENFSSVAPYTQSLSSGSLTRVILLKFSFNLDFGKSHNNAHQRISSEDTNTGIMSGSR